MTTVLQRKQTNQNTSCMGQSITMNVFAIIFDFSYIVAHFNRLAKRKHKRKKQNQKRKRSIKNENKNENEIKNEKYKE